MQYEPIKKSLRKFFSGPLFMRKLLYLIMDVLLLRAWHLRRALKKAGTELDVKCTVLDAGSGLGQYSWRMFRLHKSWKIEGVDINGDEVDDCNNWFRRAGCGERTIFKRADLTEFSAPEKYNFILSVDVMEHIQDDEKVFTNFHTSLKDNGLLMISTPSDKGGSDAHNHEEESFIDEHVRNGYGVEEITGKLERSGFIDVSVSYTYGKPGKLSWLLSMKYPVKMLNISRFFFIILPFYYVVFFPLSVILNFLDISITHKTGTGLLVTARKK